MATTRKPTVKKKTAPKAVSYKVVTSFYDKEANEALRKVGDDYDTAKVSKERLQALLNAKVIKEV